MLADLRAILAVVSVFRWGLDNVDVCALCQVCGPLDGHTRPTGAGDNTMEEFKLWDEEIFDGFVSCANSCSSVKDSLVVLVKKTQHDRYFGEGMVVN